MTTRTVIRQPITRIAVRETTKIEVVTRNIGPPGQDGAGAVDSVFGRTGAVVAANNDYALAQINGAETGGDGSKFLSDDGTYKAPASTIEERIINLGRWAWLTTNQAIIMANTDIATDSTSIAATTRIRLSSYNSQGDDCQPLFDMQSGDRLWLVSRDTEALFELTEAPTDSGADHDFQNLTRISSTGSTWLGVYTVLAVLRN